MRGRRSLSRLSQAFNQLTDRTARQALYWAISMGVMTGCVSLFLPREYKAEAKIIPNSSGPRSSSLFQLASSAGLGDALSSQLGSGENPVLTYPEILLSENVLVKTLSSPFPPSQAANPAKVIDALLVKGSSTRLRLDRGIRRMKGIVDVRANPRTTLITVSAVTRDSVLSAYIVERMLSELNRFNVESRSSRGKATREFVEGRLAEAREELAGAERALVAFRQENLRIGNSPQLQLEQVRLEREVTVRTELYHLLLRQYELARLEEKRDMPTFSVIDEARPPVRKHAPKILLNGLVAALAGAGLSLGFAYLNRPARRITMRGQVHGEAA